MKVSRSLLSSALLSTFVAASPVSEHQKRDDPLPCYVQRGTDYYGGDYDSISVASFELCAQACQYDARCVTAQYTVDNNMCYLKSVINSARSDARVDSAICKGALPSPSSTTSSTTSASTTTSQATGPTACTIATNTDYFGGDYDFFSTSTFEECSQACQDDSRCVTAQYTKIEGVCYLKSVLNTASADADVDSAICRAPQPSTTSTSTTTTTASTSITAATMTTKSTTTVATTTTSDVSVPTACSIVRDTDYFGGDYDFFSTGTFEQCAEACQGDSRCVTAQYAKNTNMCYLKSVLNDASSDAQVDTAICRHPPPITTTTTTGSSTSAFTTTLTTTTTAASSTSASTTSAAPQCTNTCVAPGSTCAVNGGGFSSSNLLQTIGGIASLDMCVASCRGYVGSDVCRSIVFNGSARFCVMFSTAGSNIPPGYGQANGVVVSYDLSCFEPCCGSATSTTSTSSTASPATTMMTATTTTTTTSSTTTVTTTAATTSSAAVGGNCYPVVGSATDVNANLAFSAVFTIDPTSSCSFHGHSGFKVVDVTGLFRGNPITFDSSLSTDNPDYCLAPSQAQFISEAGIDFNARGVTYNLNSLGPTLSLFEMTDEYGYSGLMNLALGTAQQCASG